jgi:hypothetical protein
MGNINPPESHLHVGSDTLDRRLRRGMLPEVASRGYMRKSQPNPRLTNSHRSRLRHIASHVHGRTQNRESVGEIIDKGRPELSRERERSDRESSGRCRPVLT